MASHGIPRSQNPTTTAKTAHQLQQEQDEISRYNTLTQQVNAAARSRDYSRSALDLTSTLLKWNPEYYTIWNYRRRILLSIFDSILRASERSDEDVDVNDASGGRDGDGVKAQIESDLSFLLPLLMRYPKCYWIWNYRSWLLQTTKRLLPAPDSLKLWKEELNLVSKMLSRDARNFHGWGYRREIFAEINQLLPNDEVMVSDAGVDEARLKLIEDEFKYSEKMIRANLSNFSAWHYRSFLIPGLLEAREASAQQRRELFDSELKFAKDALFDPADQSLWLQHQYLMILLVPTPLDVDIGRYKDRLWVQFSDQEREEILRGEIEFIREILEDVDDCKWVYQSLLKYVEIYLKLDGADPGVVTKQEMKDWLQSLDNLDPLRKARWNELHRKIDLN